jgi:hypothetical protein
MRAKQSGAHKVRRIINLVGEEIAAQEEAGSAALECMEILKAIDERGIHSCISVKPKRLCQAIDKRLFRAHNRCCRRVGGQARELNANIGDVNS